MSIARITSILSVLPPPLSFGLLALASFMAFSVVRQAGWWLVAGAAALWVVVLLGIAHRLELAPSVTGGRLAQPFFSWLLGAADPSRTPAGPPAATPAQREAARDAAFEVINGLIGIGDAQDRIQRLLSLGKSASERGEPGFGTGMPGVLLVLSGPSGTGKSTVARALPGLLFGHGVTAKPDVVELGQHDVAVHPAGIAAHVRALAKRSAGGVLLIEDAGWLTTAAYGSEPVGGQVGSGLYQAAADQPGAVTIVMVAEAGLPQGGSISPHLSWTSRLHTIRIAFDPLSESDLVEIFCRALKQRRAVLKDEASERVAHLIRAEMRAGGERFSNAIAAQGLAGRVIEQAAERLRGSRLPSGQLIIEAQDIRELQKG